MIEKPENRKMVIEILLNYLLQEDRETIVEKNKNHIMYIGIIIIIICIIIIKRKIGKRTNGA